MVKTLCVHSLLSLTIVNHFKRISPLFFSLSLISLKIKKKAKNKKKKKTFFIVCGVAILLAISFAEKATRSSTTQKVKTVISIGNLIKKIK